MLNPIGFVFITVTVCIIPEFPVSEANDSVPFIDVRIFPGYLELKKTEVDSVSDPVYIPGGLLFGDEIVSVLYVSFPSSR